MWLFLATHVLADSHVAWQNEPALSCSRFCAVMRLHFPELRPNSKRPCCECDDLAAIIADAKQAPADKSRAYQQKRLHNERVQLERTHMIELEVQAQTQPVRRLRTHICAYLSNFPLRPSPLIDSSIYWHILLVGVISCLFSLSLSISICGAGCAISNVR